MLHRADISKKSVPYTARYVNPIKKLEQKRKFHIIKYLFFKRKKK